LDDQNGDIMQLDSSFFSTKTLTSQPKTEQNQTQGCCNKDDSKDESRQSFKDILSSLEGKK
jgi:hypothetical protein